MITERTSNPNYRCDSASFGGARDFQGVDVRREVRRPGDLQGRVSGCFFGWCPMALNRVAIKYFYISAFSQRFKRQVVTQVVTLSFFGAESQSNRLHRPS